MKRLFSILGLMILSGSALAYRPAGYPPVPYPYQPYPPYPVFRQAPNTFAPPVMPAQPYPYGYPAPAYTPWAWRQAAPVQPAAPASSSEVSPAPATEPESAPVVEAAPVETQQEQTGRAREYQREFLEMLRPIVERENARLRALRTNVQGMLDRLAQDRVTEAERRELLGLARHYRVEGRVLSDPDVREDLLSRIDTIPVALALAQAANESAWGTSRFAREGNNLFGIWTYDESKGIVPKGRAEGAKHLVRKFEGFDESVRYYMHTLNSHPAYQPLRDARSRAREQGERPTALALAGGLVKYSARGESYVEHIRRLITRYRLATLATADQRAG
jgi:Bax protein